MLYVQEIAKGLVNADNHEWQINKYGQSILGVRSSKSVWFWYVLFDDVLIFDHAYSQINGSTMKDKRARTRAINLLNKL